MPRKTAAAKVTREAATKGRTAGRREKIAATLATLNQIEAPDPQTARAIALFSSWLSDESGYDEDTWPKLKSALDRERKRVGARRLFDG